jgi:hypothetical protein
MKYTYAVKMIFDVVSFQQQTPWSATKLFCHLKKTKMKATTGDMKPIAINLYNRISKELKFYKDEPSNHEYLAMACHPYMATRGMYNLEMYRELLDPMKREKTIVEKSKEILYNAIMAANCHVGHL